MKEYRYVPKGVCSTNMIIQLEEDVIQKVQIIDGCAGNTAGVSKLVEGMKLDEVIKKLKDISCRNRGTSCPDQLARALEQIKKEREEKKEE